MTAGSVLVNGGEWAQYRGLNGDGISRDTVAASWPTGGPKRVWSVKTTGGFSSFAVSGGKAFTVVSRDSGGLLSEVCIALDAATGKELWATPTGPAKYRGGAESGAEGNKGGDGPRSTPAVSGGRVYVYTAHAVLHCLDAATGKSIWTSDIIKDFGGQNIAWESALSPVVDGELVYVAGGGAGQAMLAFKQSSGEVAWKTGDEGMTQATPVVVTIGGVRQIIYFMQSGLVSLDAASGKGLWKFAFPFKVATACSPVVSGHVIFCTAGYEVGGAACQIVKNGDTWEAKELWRKKTNQPVADLWSTPICKDGYLYGMISFKQFAQGPLKCIDLKTGTLKWEQSGFGAGNVVLAGNHLIALADDGRLVLIQPTPDGYREIARTKAIEGKCWSSPALADGHLFVRSTKEGACFDLAGAK